MEGQKGGSHLVCHDVEDVRLLGRHDAFSLGVRFSVLEGIGKYKLLCTGVERSRHRKEKEEEEERERRRTSSYK